MFRKYPLFQSHIDLAHNYWEKLILPTDTVIDATCGNGQDTLVIARLALQSGAGKVFAYDIQESAIEKTRDLLSTQISSDQLNCITFIKGCHSVFPQEIALKSVKLIVYNLGYLPGGDKTVTTRVETTLNSIESALSLICPGGMLSITCYPGHPQGLLEEEALVSFAALLEAKEWSCCHHRWLNRRFSPSLLIIQRCC